MQTEKDIFQKHADIFKFTVSMNNIKVGGAPVDVMLSENRHNYTVRVTEEEKRAIDLLKKNSEYKISELVEMLGVSRKTVNNHLKKLNDKGIIEWTGSDKKRCLLQ